MPEALCTGPMPRVLPPVLNEARLADVVVKCSGVGVLDEMLEEAVLELKGPNRKVVFWDVDAPATLERAGADHDDPFRKLIPDYDLILTYGGGDPVVRTYKRLGARQCVPIYNALTPSTHHPVEPQDRFEADLAFCGNRMPDREARVAEFFFKPACLAAQASIPAGRQRLGRRRP